MTDREAIELMAFFFAVLIACQVWAVLIACQVWLWVNAKNATKDDG